MDLLKRIPVAVGALVASAAFAAMDTESRITQLETQMKQVRTETATGTFGAQTASARPETDGYGVYVMADLLYWRARIDGTEFVLSNQNNTQTAPLLPRVGDIYEVQPDWNWGFRVGVGYNFDHDGWDAQAEYTWFRSNDSLTKGSGAIDSLVPLKGASMLRTGTVGSINRVGTARSSARISLNNLDLNLGRNYFVSSHLSFRPSLGVQFAWIDLRQKTSYTGGDLDTSSSVVRDKEDYFGVGPRLALEGKWHIGRGFSFFGNVYGGLLYGQFDVAMRNSYSSNADNYIYLTQDFHQFNVNARLFMGLAYDAYFDNDKQHFGLTVGYDTQYWWALQRYINVTDQYSGAGTATQQTFYGRTSGDVGLQGLTIMLRWDF